MTAKRLVVFYVLHSGSYYTVIIATQSCGHCE